MKTVAITDNFYEAQFICDLLEEENFDWTMTSPPALSLMMPLGMPLAAPLLFVIAVETDQEDEARDHINTLLGRG